MLEADPTNVEYLIEMELVKEVCGVEEEEERGPLLAHQESHDLNLVGVLFNCTLVMGFNVDHAIRGLPSDYSCLASYKLFLALIWSISPM